MLTIKLPYNTDDYTIINEIIRQQSIIRKYSYNRFKDGYSEKDIRKQTSFLNNIGDIDSWFIQSSILDGKQIYKTNKDKKVIFNKLNFIRRQKGLITKNEYQELKNDYVYSIGESLQKGNRKFTLDIDNNNIIFKPNRNNKIILTLPKLKNNIKTILNKLECLSKDKKTTITYKLDKKYIYITYDETVFVNKIILNENRIIGVDLNPNNIGISILEFNNDKFNILKTYSFNLSGLTDKKSNHNKLKHETIEICKYIINIGKEYKVKYIGIEELSLKTSDKGKGKNNNSLLNNKWLRNLVENQLTKRCNLYNMRLMNVLPYYSSFIGNLQYDYVDEINASIEIGRRTYECFILKNKRFYPEMNIKDGLIHQWKECVNFDIFDDWKKLFNNIKNSKLRYRVSLDDCNRLYNVLRIKSVKSKTLLYVFV